MTAALKQSSASLVTVQVERARELLSQARTVQEAREVLDQAEAMRVYLRRQEAALELQADAYAITQYAMRRMGELCRELPSDQGRRSDKQLSHAGVTKSEALEKLGVLKGTAHRWEKLAEIPDAEFDARLELGRARILKVETSGASAISAASGYDGDEAYTPPKFIEAAREVLGDIELDPASCAVAQRTVRADRFLAKRQNGLGAPWLARTVWLNSPYSYPLVRDFQQKFVADFAAGYFKAGITLVNNATDTSWFQALLGRFAACFPEGRISFVNAQGVEMGQNRQGQAFFYAGPARQRFHKVFGQFGKVVVPA